MSIDEMKRRITRLEAVLSSETDKTQDLADKVTNTSGLDDKSTSDLALAKMKVEVIRQSLDDAKADLKDEETRMTSPEYRAVVKRLDASRSDIDKKVSVIDDTVTSLIDQVDDLVKSCKDYDRLKYQLDGHPDLYGHLSSYGWIVLLKSYLDRLSHDYVFKAR